MNILITAGPTYEYIDRVRYLANASSGKMGYELARAAKRGRHKVVLVSGPTNLEPPKGVQLVNVTSAQEMYQVTKDLFTDCDALIMSAAVSDYRPALYFSGKLKKRRKNLVLHLVPNVDILKELSSKKGARIVIGFALEVANARKNAMKKLHDKNLDYIVLNSPDAFGKDSSSAEIWTKDGLIKRFINKPKRQISKFIISLLSNKR